MQITNAVPDAQATGRLDYRPDYSRNPLIVYWEMTRACGLACRHCRAEAMPCADPLQLTTSESHALLGQIAAFGAPLPHLVLTGGDPLERTDLFEMIDEAVNLGIGVSITPAATPKLTPEVLYKLKQHGIESLGLSLDGSNRERHDSIRQVHGCFERTIAAARAAADCGLPIQINTLVAQETADDLPAIYELLKTLRIMRWSLFFLIGMGRGRVLMEMEPQPAELLMGWIHDLSRVAPFAIKTTEAPSYRRVVLERMRLEGKSMADVRRTAAFRGFGIRDGNGIVFVSHNGDVFPSGFLPLTAGNVLESRLADIYRTSPKFIALRKPAQFKGQCGYCEFHGICGGSRARAFAHTDDPLESDPLCAYQPDAAMAIREHH